jgi:hypothetical protein
LFILFVSFVTEKPQEEEEEMQKSEEKRVEGGCVGKDDLLFVGLKARRRSVIQNVRHRLFC